MAAGLLLGVIVAQTVQAQSTADGDLERIRKALAEAPAISVPAPTGADGPVFRVTIREKRPVEPLWGNWSAVPSNIRPKFGADHHEFLEQVLKNRERAEQFRGPTLYPSGVDIVQVAENLAKHIKAANRKRQEQNAREEVRRAMDALRACQADPTRPGC